MLLGIGGITGAGASEKALDRFYFTVAKGIIFRVADMLIVGSCEIIDSERTVTLLDNFNEIDFFNELGLGPAPVLIRRQGDMVVRGRACERETIG